MALRSSVRGSCSQHAVCRCEANAFLHSLSAAGTSRQHFTKVASMTTNIRLAAIAVAIAITPFVVQAGADPQRQAEVARLGSDVMPFSVKATTHVFTKTAHGGTQRVVAKSLADAGQVKLVREHLHDIQSQFLKGDFSGPAHIHGDEMPGLAELKAAKPGQVAIDYKDVAGGAELNFRTADAKLVHALHEWFDAQVSDHGSDAMAGHQHNHTGMTKQ